MHLGIAILVWNTSFLGLVLNVNTQGSATVSEILAFNQMAGMIGTFGTLIWMKKYNQINVRGLLPTIRIVIACMIGDGLAMLIINSYCFWVTRDIFWFLVAGMNLSVTVIIVVGRLVLLRKMRVLIAKDGKMTT